MLVGQHAQHESSRILAAFDMERSTVPPNRHNPLRTGCQQVTQMVDSFASEFLETWEPQAR